MPLGWGAGPHGPPPHPPQGHLCLSGFGLNGLSRQWVELSCLPWMLILLCMLICGPSALQHAHPRARRVETCAAVGSPTSAILSFLCWLIPRRFYFLPLAAPSVLCRNNRTWGPDLMLLYTCVEFGRLACTCIILNLLLAATLSQVIQNGRQLILEGGG